MIPTEAPTDGPSTTVNPAVVTNPISISRGKIKIFSLVVKDRQHIYFKDSNITLCNLFYPSDCRTT